MQKATFATRRVRTTHPETPPFHVAMVSPEIVPFAKTGGLGDVLGSLPQALEKTGLKISLFMPAYRSVLRGKWRLEDTGRRLSVPVSDRMEEATVLRTKIGRDISVYFIRADKYFDRDELYNTSAGNYTDNAERFVFFSRAVLEFLRSDPPAILHGNDWQSAMTVVFLKTQPQMYPELAFTKSVFSIHNLGFQGIFWRQDWHLLNLDNRYFTPQYLEFYGNINFLKGAVVLADAVTTVSPTYAAETKTAEYGFALEGVLRERGENLVGILNGVDYQVWNPETDCNIIRTYSCDDFAGKIMCKSDLQRTFGINEELDVPLVAMVSRLTLQKGIELIQEAIDGIMSRRVQFVLMGTGSQEYEESFSGLPDKYQGRLGVQIKFDEIMVHKLVAGADILLIPSIYEPCGLTQMYGLRYGTPAIVRATGGLKDTIVEYNPVTRQGNGFLFNAGEVSDLLSAIDRALWLFHREDDWLTLMSNGMKADFSWKKSAIAYKELYHKIASA